MVMRAVDLPAKKANRDTGFQPVLTMSNDENFAKPGFLSLRAASTG